ncbi:unnamed protein product [Pedinophyceae sp. YPF-701]|nr:unnamed protein product [Pedinophyceae sp. YPF-701]
MDLASRYEKVSLIGKGSFGDVWKGIDQETGAEVAIKIIDMEDVEDDLEDLMKEIDILARSKSKNITEYMHSFNVPGTSQLWIIMQLMACSALDMIQEEPLDEPAIAFVVREVLNALDYLHSQHRIHRDIKAANVLLTPSGEVKITDFGVSGTLTNTLSYKRKTFVGTPFWMAPEVIQAANGEAEGYTEAADIWSLGITAYELATGQPPHASLHPMRALFLIPKGDPPQLSGPYSDGFKDFMKQCLQKEAEKRPSAQDLLQHRFLLKASCPPSLVRRVVETQQAMAKRPRLLQPVTSTVAAGSKGTLPQWQFETPALATQQAEPAGAAASGPSVADGRASHQEAGSRGGTSVGEEDAVSDKYGRTLDDLRARAEQGSLTSRQTGSVTGGQSSGRGGGGGGGGGGGFVGFVGSAFKSVMGAVGGGGRGGGDGGDGGANPGAVWRAYENAGRRTVHEFPATAAPIDAILGAFADMEDDIPGACECFAVALLEQSVTLGHGSAMRATLDRILEQQGAGRSGRDAGSARGGELSSGGSDGPPGASARGEVPDLGALGRYLLTRWGEELGKDPDEED